MNRLFALVTLWLMLALAGCGTVAVVPTPTPIPPTLPPELPTSIPDPTPAAPPSGNAGGLGVSDAILEQALAQVAAQTGLPVEQLEVTATETVEWASSALGCPMPGQMYLDVITPGYRVEVRAGDELFDVGTNLDGSAFAVCPRMANN